MALKFSILIWILKLNYIVTHYSLYCYFLVSFTPSFSRLFLHFSALIGKPKKLPCIVYIKLYWSRTEIINFNWVVISPAKSDIFFLDTQYTYTLCYESFLFRHTTRFWLIVACLVQAISLATEWRAQGRAHNPCTSLGIHFPRADYGELNRMFLEEISNGLSRTDQLCKDVIDIVGVDVTINWLLLQRYVYEVHFVNQSHTATSVMDFVIGPCFIVNSFTSKAEIYIL